MVCLSPLMRLGIAETDLSGERACKFCPLHHGKTLLCVLVMCFLFKNFIVLFLPSYFQVHLFGFIKFIVSLVNFLLSCLPWPLPFYTFPCIWICFIQFVPPKFCSYLYSLAFASSIFITVFCFICSYLFVLAFALFVTHLFVLAFAFLLFFVLAFAFSCSLLPRPLPTFLKFNLISFAYPWPLPLLSSTLSSSVSAVLASFPFLWLQFFLTWIPVLIFLFFGWVVLSTPTVGVLLVAGGPRPTVTGSFGCREIPPSDAPGPSSSSGSPSGPLASTSLILAPVGLACAFSPSCILLSTAVLSLVSGSSRAHSLVLSSVVRWPSTSVCSPPFFRVSPVRVPWLLSSWTGSSAVSCPALLRLLGLGSG